MSVAVIIVAAGRGHRMAGAVPKQYLSLSGVAILRRTVDAMLVLPAIGRVLTVIHPDDAALYWAAMQGISDARVGGPVPGGATRAASVKAGLDALADDAPDLVLIHDAARPFCDVPILSRVLEALDDCDGAFAALPVIDAMWRVDAQGRAEEVVSRDNLWRAQTPQGFRYAAICAAHAKLQGDAADDVAVARSAGMDVRAVMGHEDNFKITVSDDLRRAERIIAEREAQTKTGASNDAPVPNSS